MAENVFAWSITAADNDDADPAVPFPEGMNPGSVNNAARALMAGVARLRDDMVGAITTTGSAGSYAATSRSGYTALATNLSLTLTANVTNTAGATLNVNTLGAKSIRVFVNGAEAAVAAGQIIVGGRYQFVYDTALNSSAGGWLLLNPSPDPLLLIQVGQTMLWHTDTLPSGNWLWANGSAVSRTTYAALFAVISTTYGAGDGSTTFNLPDLCGRSPFGSDDMGGISAKSRITNAGSGIVGTTLGATGGAENHTLTLAQTPSHQHTGTTANQNQNHTHSGTTGTESATHTHSEEGAAQTRDGQFTGPGGSGWSGNPSQLNTGNASATHTHTFTTGIESGGHTHDFTTDFKGSDTAHNNMPPALIVNFVIRY